MLKKIALGALAPVVVLGTLALGGAAHAATTPTPTPLSVSLQSCGTGSAAVFTSGNPVLTIGTAPGATCGAPAGSTYDPAYAQVVLNGVAGTAVPTAEPVFATDHYTNGSPRIVIELNNGKSLWGYPAASGLNGSDMAWAVGNAGTYTNYATALTGASASSTTVKQAFIVEDADQAQGTKDTITSLQYANQTLGGGGVVTFPQPANISDVLGTAITPVKMGASSTVSDPAITYVVNPFTPLPNGLTLSPAGVLSGTPTAASGSVVTVTAEDAYGNTASRSFNVIVREHGKPAPKPQPAPFPHLTHGHILNVGYNVAQIGWDYVGYPKGQLQCALTETYGYGFSTGNQPIKFTFVPKGFAMDKNAHVGFTCYNPTKLIDQPSGDVGFWWGLAAHHTYDILVIPATPNRQPITGSPVGWVNIVTR